ncbi:MAG: Fic family protein [Nitrosotalea sp.]
MDEAAFDRPSGKLVKNASAQTTFLPNMLPPTITYDKSLITFANEASNQLGQLSGIGALLPNPDLIIRPCVYREAVLSSKIEGTQASMLDLFRYNAGAQEGADDKRQKRITEVINYVSASRECLKKINNGNKVDLKMIKEAHKMLLTGVRGQELEPGKIRTIQNWIGPEGTKIADATYVPPPPEYVLGLLSDLEKFIHEPQPYMPPLIQCAIMHYQFEAIHPFGDGNGRIGRLLVPLVLSERKLLSQPILYLSAYIEQNKTRYYQSLLEVSQKSKWNEWIQFFLMSVITQAQDAIKRIQKLMELRAKYEKKLREKKASTNVVLLNDLLFANPLVTIPKAADFLQITYPPAKKAVEYLVDIGILKEYEAKERNKLFIAYEIEALLR